jgi:hypothetical protein
MCALLAEENLGPDDLDTKIKKVEGFADRQLGLEARSKIH